VPENVRAPSSDYFLTPLQEPVNVISVKSIPCCLEAAPPVQGQPGKLAIGALNGEVLVVNPLEKNCVPLVLNKGTKVSARVVAVRWSPNDARRLLFSLHADGHLYKWDSGVHCDIPLWL